MGGTAKGTGVEPALYSIACEKIPRSALVASLGSMSHPIATVEVAEKVSTPVLLQVRQHFIGRKNAGPLRVFFPKGNLAKAQAVMWEIG